MEELSHIRTKAEFLQNTVTSISKFLTFLLKYSQIHMKYAGSVIGTLPVINIQYACEYKENQCF